MCLRPLIFDHSRGRRKSYVTCPGDVMARPNHPARVSQLPSVRALAIQKGLLVHEVDEGSKCLKCGPGCKGFSLHFWRKVCANCLCPREEHDIRIQEDRQQVVGKLLFYADSEQLMKGASPKRPRAKLSSRDEHDSPQILRKTENYTWVPRDITLSTARAFFEGMPENKRPISGTPGNRYWQKQKIRQLPGHDLDLIYCNDLTNEECKQMELFVKIRKEKFLGRGKIRQKTADDKTDWSCEKCRVRFRVGEAAVTSERLLPGKYWHPACFCCTECNEVLIELIYFVYENKLHCGRHHAEKLKPRCSACDEIIFCAEYTCAEDQNWHVNHFCCFNCDKELGGEHYMAKESKPYCLECFDRYFAAICEECGNTIPLDKPRLGHEGKYWHATPECFKCRQCQKVLLEEPFLPKSGKIFCSKACLREFKSSKKE